VFTVVYNYRPLCSQLFTILVPPREQRTRHLRHGLWRSEGGANP